MRRLWPLFLCTACFTKSPDIGAEDGDWTNDSDMARGQCKDTLGISGLFKMGRAEFPINEISGEGLDFATEHKLDVDLFEAGCISNINLEIKQGGLGCNIELDFQATEGNGFALSSLVFVADSYCPNFPDDLEGTYRTRGSIPLAVSGLPSKVDLETGTEERVCLQGIDFRFDAQGILEQENGDAEENFELRLQLTGDHWSTGSATAVCDEENGSSGGGSESGAQDPGSDDGGNGDDGGENEDGGDEDGGDEDGGEEEEEEASIAGEYDGKMGQTSALGTCEEDVTLYIEEDNSFIVEGYCEFGFTSFMMVFEGNFDDEGEASGTFTAELPFGASESTDIDGFILDDKIDLSAEFSTTGLETEAYFRTD